MDLGLRGRRALVTGASKGIGLACAEALAAEGCDLVLVSRSLADLQAAQARLRAARQVGVEVRAHDLADSRAVDALAAEFPVVDILVNNAGAIPGGTLDEVDEARWRAAWDLKVFGYINMSRRFYAVMRERGRGVIVNIIGAAGESPDAAYVAGSAGNAALMALTRALGGAAPDDGLRVVGINPGPILSSTLHVSFGRWHGKPLMHLSPRLRPSLPRRLATDAESANTRRDGKEGAEASGQAADPPRLATRALPYRAANGTCKVELRPSELRVARDPVIGTVLEGLSAVTFRAALAELVALRTRLSTSSLYGQAADMYRHRLEALGY